jgi:hypothetical protein
MIVQKFNINEIHTLKLMTGEEIITKLTAVDDFGYSISKPLVLSMTAEGVAMTPFLFTAEIKGVITIPKAAVIAIAPTDKQTAGQYIQGTTSIMTPGASGLGKLV